MDIKVLILLLTSVSSLGSQSNNMNAFCGRQKTCGDCLDASQTCCWCFDYEYNKENSGCNTNTSLLATGCNWNSIKCRNKTKVFEPKDIDASTDSKPIQLNPRRLTLHLSPNDEQNVTYKYTLVKDYPLDLYYLMDLTWSMRDDKETLVGLRDRLPKFLETLTKNFRIGFGSFAEKPSMANTRHNSENSCKSAIDICEPTYSYRHRLNMTKNIDDFVDTVSNSRVTANLDKINSGLDALMQVLVCEERVGWNRTSRKIVIFTTDGMLHFSGDGLLGGIIEPNDKKCHLNINGEYTKAKTMDYPSLEGIYRVLLTHRISIIFAVTKAVIHHYENIGKIFPDDVFVGELKDDSSNILDLVKLGYQRLSNVIKFQDNADDMFRIKYFSDCGVHNRPLETSKCENIKIGKEYTFVANITLKQCPKSRMLKHEIKISEERLRQDELVLNVTVNCGCDCEEQNRTCAKNSKLECGKCVCSDGWFGRNCDCFEREGLAEDTSNCKKEDEVEVCSGVGGCACGTCHCDFGYAGAFCECKSCPVSVDSRQTCGGVSRGTCDCGVCVCQKPYYGPTCSSTGPETNCSAPWDTKECSGNGTCYRGDCRCHQGYFGKYCEACDTCENPACSLYQDCVLCTVDDSCSESDCLSKDGTKYKTVIIEDYFEETGNIVHCVYNNKSREAKFTYGFENDRSVVLNIYKEKSISYVSIFLILITIVIVIGVSFGVNRIVKYFFTKKYISYSMIPGQ